MARLVPVSCRARVDFDGLELDKSFVERSKESLDPVVPNLVVADVIQIFRPLQVDSLFPISLTSKKYEGGRFIIHYSLP